MTEFKAACQLTKQLLLHNSVLTKLTNEIIYQLLSITKFKKVGLSYLYIGPKK